MNLRDDPSRTTPAAEQELLDRVVQRCVMIDLGTPILDRCKHGNIKDGVRHHCQHKAKMIKRLYRNHLLKPPLFLVLAGR
jgi:hypothetical protein